MEILEDGQETGVIIKSILKNALKEGVTSQDYIEYTMNIKNLKDKKPEIKTR